MDSRVTALAKPYWRAGARGSRLETDKLYGDPYYEFLLLNAPPLAKEAADAVGGEIPLDSPEYTFAFLHAVESLMDPKVPINTKTGEQLRIVRSIAIASDQNVYLAIDASSSREWVVKWSTNESIARELQTYQKIRKLGGKTPEVLSDWKMGPNVALVMERLIPLDPSDDEFEMAIQLLSNQLPFIHQFAVHADLKPDNIMKKHQKDGSKSYYIIDMDVSDKRVDCTSFARTHFTPLFHSDIVGSKCTFRSDLLELRATMIALFLQRARLDKNPLFFEPNQFINNQYAVMNVWTRVLKQSRETCPDPLMYLKEIPNTHYRLREAMRNVLHGTVPVFAFILMADYIEKSVPLGAEPSARFYTDLVNILLDKRTRSDRLVQSCLRCGGTPKVQEANGADRRFCNDICQRVFYDFH